MPRPLRPRPAPPRASRLRRAAAALVAPLAVALGACADGRTGALLGPPPAIAATTGGSGTTPGGATAGALVGRWTRLDAGGTTETSFAFGGDGSGTRITVLRTALGAVISTDAQPFRWTAGGGIVVFRFPAPGNVGAEQVLRASFRVDQAIGGTTLVLDGVAYGRAG